MALTLSDLVEYKGVKYSLMVGPNPRRLHDMCCVPHRPGIGFMCIDDAIDLGLEPIEEPQQ